MKKWFLLIALTSACTACTYCRKPQREKILKETYYHQYGVTLPEKEWHDRGMNGQIARTLENGVTVTRTYTKGELNGPATYTFAHSKIVEVAEEYERGALAKRTVHYSSGAPKQQEEFIAPEAKLITSWYEDGIPLYIESYVEDKLVEGRYFTPLYEEASVVRDGEGMRVFRDVYGQVLSNDLIEAGEMIERTTYHPNGNPKMITPYAQGKISGVRRTFLPAGEPNTVEEWTEGLQHGMTLVFENGERIARIPYKMGKKHGIEKRYREEERIVEEISWEEGKRQGPTHIFVEGNVETKWYYEDRLVSKAGYDLMKNPTIR